MGLQISVFCKKIDYTIMGSVSGECSVIQLYLTDGAYAFGLLLIYYILNKLYFSYKYHLKHIYTKSILPNSYSPNPPNHKSHIPIIH